MGECGIVSQSHQVCYCTPGTEELTVEHFGSYQAMALS
jgi:hypothetical protein